MAWRGPPMADRALNHISTQCQTTSVHALALQGRESKLLPPEHRIALLLVGREPLPEVAALLALSIAPHGGGAVELAAGDLVDGALHTLHRMRRERGEPRGERIG